MGQVLDAVSRIVESAPHPGVGYHNELHIEPEIFTRLTKELNPPVCPVQFQPRGSARELPKSIFLFGLPVYLDVTTTYAEVVLMPDPPRSLGVWDRVERWIMDHT